MVRKIGKSKDFTMEGEGILVLKHPSGKVITYTGEFMNDKKNGYGILKKEQPSKNDSDVLELIDRVEGNWRDGKLHGFCFQLYSDGSTFEGM